MGTTGADHLALCALGSGRRPGGTDLRATIIPARTPDHQFANVGKLNSRPYQDLDVLGTPVQYGLGDHFAMDSRLLVKKPGGGQADLGVLLSGERQG